MKKESNGDRLERQRTEQLAGEEHQRKNKGTIDDQDIIMNALPSILAGNLTEEQRKESMKPCGQE